MNKHRYVFLDIDGVLNCNDWYNYLYNLKRVSPKEYEKLNTCKYWDAIDPSKVELLNQLTGAEIVISSSWTLDTIAPVLKIAGLKLPILGEIDHKEFGYFWIHRGNSIEKWLVDKHNCNFSDYLFNDDGWRYTEHYFDGNLNDLKETIAGDQVTYVIFDDDCDMSLLQLNHFIHVNNDVGLTSHDIRLAKAILNID